MSERGWYGLLLITGIFFALTLGYVTGNIHFTNMEDWGNDSGSYNSTALAIINYHTFHEPGSLFFGPFQRPPGYPIFLALAYRVAGPWPPAAWALQMAIWLLSLILVKKISEYFISGAYSFMPAFFLACYWGAATTVIDINSDLFTLFLILLFVFTFLRSVEKQTIWNAVVLGCIFGLLVLTKPIMLYAACLMPFVYLLHTRVSRLTVALGILTLCIILGMAGLWSLYNYRLLGTPQLASGALTLMRRADDVEMTGSRIAAFTLASATGDYIADTVYPGYARDPEPYTKVSNVREKLYYQRQRPDKRNEKDLQTEYYEQANFLIKQHPIQFALTSGIYILRLNAPVNQRGVEMIHTFVGSKETLSSTQKIFLLLGIRILWGGFLCAVLWAISKCFRDWRRWTLILFLIVYFNIMYALVSHAEARYILPVIPFYFLLLTFFIRQKMMKFGQ